LIAKTVLRPFKADRPELNYDPRQPDRVVINCADGRHEVDIPYPLGAPQNPLPESQLREKFRLNSALDEVAIEHSWERLCRWPGAADIHDLFRPSPAA
jgi:2-methylcitrate dehydratase PrpD